MLEMHWNELIGSVLNFLEVRKLQTCKVKSISKQTSNKLYHKQTDTQRSVAPGQLPAFPSC